VYDWLYGSVRICRDIVLIQTTSRGITDAYKLLSWRRRPTGTADRDDVGGGGIGLSAAEGALEADCSSRTYESKKPQGKARVSERPMTTPPFAISARCIWHWCMSTTRLCNLTWNSRPLSFSTASLQRRSHDVWCLRWGQKHNIHQLPCDCYNFFILHLLSAVSSGRCLLSKRPTMRRNIAQPLRTMSCACGNG